MAGRHAWLRREIVLEMIAHAHIDADHQVMSHDGLLFEKLLSVDTDTG
jgi:hypothetical protein